MTLEEQIEKGQRAVVTDAYQMSIGEVVNLYKDGELIINPDFQRLFRWDELQKSRLIESILLGIPIPPIFVFEEESGKWELVDGLQRLSTLLEFMGLLRDANDKPSPPISLVATKYLSELQNVVWETSNKITSIDKAQQKAIGKPIQLAIRRARIGVQILKRPSDAHTKYELFQRLNSAGTIANPQELRNCIVIMANKKFFLELRELEQNEDFNLLLQLTEDARNAQKTMEYLMRFIVYVFLNYDGTKDVEDFIDDGIVQIAEKPNLEQISKTFTQTFKLIREGAGEDGLKRYENKKFGGRVGYTTFETVAVGVARNLPNILKRPDSKKFVLQKIQALWVRPEVEAFSAPGLRGTQRIQRTIPFGEKWFAGAK